MEGGQDQGGAYVGHCIKKKQMTWQFKTRLTVGPPRSFPRVSVFHQPVNVQYQSDFEKQK
jgi:hypothetical protein